MKLLLWLLAIVVLLLIVLALLILFRMWSFDRQMSADAEELLEWADTAARDVITEEDLQHLPEPVQRYFRYTGVVGMQPVRSAIVTQEGRFRMSPDGEWIPFAARETYTTNPEGFVWQARMKMAGLPILRVRDYYREGEGGILAKLGGLITVADQRADEASLMRYFNELMWIPTGYLADNVTWEAVDENSARGTMTDEGMTVSALFIFDDEGRLVNFEAERFASTTGQKETWITPLDTYGEFEGLRLPTHGQGIWLLEEGDFAYVDLVITDVQYDVQ